MNSWYSNHLVGWALAFAVGCASCADDARPPIKVGVLLPLTGASAAHLDEPLEWAKDEINRRGGVRGRPLELVYADIGAIPTGTPDAPRAVWEVAKRFLSDPEIDIVIGTDDDDTTFGIAPSFVRASKILISPAAATADLTRAFGDSKFVRRTIATDAAQAQLMVAYAKRTGAQTVSVVTTGARGGATYFDWIPFHAEEARLTVRDARRIDVAAADCSEAMTQVLAHGTPDILYLVPGTTAQADCMVRRARALMPSARLFLNDPKRFDGLFDGLGALAEGLEGISLEAPLEPAVGPPFKETYTRTFGHAPPVFAANLFDSVALAAYALARANGARGDALASAMDDVVHGAGETTGWNRDGMNRALRLIEGGAPLPDLTGATGALSYQARSVVELTSSTFALWQVRGGVQQWDRVDAGGRTIAFPSNFLSIDTQTNPFDAPPDLALLSPATEAATGYVPAERKGGWAFIAAMSSTMNNYRHQADALHMYQLLKRRGFRDDHIILVAADDIAGASTNPRPGTVTNIGAGPNLRAGDVEVDYHVGDLSSEGLLDILQGKKTATTPKVIESTANDDVFVFWVGHGGDGGVLVGDSAQAGQGTEGQFITPFALARAVQAKFDAHGFRQMVIALDACHGGVMGEALQIPGVVLLAGASPHESSFASNFDSSTNVWHADAFAWAIASRIEAAPDASIASLYAGVYADVRGSHPRMYNAAGFGQAATVTIGAILTP
jgi:ABC-type branched-subunit amino acid transport system substrate-binding protein